MSEPRPETSPVPSAPGFSVGDRVTWINQASNEAGCYGAVVEVISDRHPLMGRKMVEIKDLRDGATSWVHAADLKAAPGPVTPQELAAIEAAKRPSAAPAPSQPRRVYLDPVGLMAWHGLMAMGAAAVRRIEEADAAEKKAHEARVLSLMTHLGALDILGPLGPDGPPNLGLGFESGKPYLVAVRGDHATEAPEDEAPE